MLGANDGIVSTASPVLGLSPTARLVRLVAVASLLCLGALGAIAARTGGARALERRGSSGVLGRSRDGSDRGDRKDLR